jgi:hypothetical protein
MSRQTRMIAYIGNGVLALLSALAMMAALGRGHVGPAVVLALICGLGIFNIRLVSKASAAISEEEWLASEVRKGEMRRRLVGLADQGFSNVVPPDVLAKHKSESFTQSRENPPR